MIEAGKTYKYLYTHNNTIERGDDVLVEQVVNGVAIATSGAFADFGPFTMKFDAKSGQGIDDYSNAYII